MNEQLIQAATVASSIAAAVSAVTTIVLAGITGWYAVQTRVQAVASRAAVEEMRAARLAQGRAYVTVELWPWSRGMGLFDFAIRNYGAAAARDVRVTFDPDFRQPQYSGGTINELEVFRRLPFIAPDDEVVFFAGHRPWLWADDIPRIWTGRVQFTDDVGSHEMPFEIRLGQFERVAVNLPYGGPRKTPPVRRGWVVCDWEEDGDRDSRRA